MASVIRITKAGVGMDVGDNRERLAETISWCLAQPLECTPIETADVQYRRQLIERAGELMRQAHRAIKKDEISKMFKTREYLEASRLLQEADPDSIEPLRGQLRTNSLKPFSMLDCFPRTTAERTSIVDDVANRRAALLKTMRRYPTISQPNLNEGRILLYAPDDNLADGAAKYPSKGFFDVNNVPPWDTWICYVDRYLVSWVPSVLEELASAGIAVNPEECIQWAGPAFLNSVMGVDAQ